MSAQSNETGALSFLLGEPAATGIERYALVRRDFSDPTKVVYCDAGEDPLGPSVFSHPRSSGQDVTDEMVAVYPLHQLSSCKVIASGAISDGDNLYTAADGRVAASGSGDIIGTARGSASSNGDVIEMIPAKNGWTPRPSAQFSFFDDFDHYVSADRWTPAVDAGGSIAVGDAHGGQLVITNDGDDEDGSTFATTNELVLIQANKSGSVSMRAKIVEAATDDLNFFFGLSDLVTVDLMVDAGAGPATSFDGAGFYKVDGGTKFGIITSNAATQDKDADQGSALVSGTWYEFEIKWVADATNATVQFFLDGVQLGVDHTLALSGLAECHVAVAIKNGGGNAEAITVDWIGVTFDR